MWIEFEAGTAHALSLDNSRRERPVERVAISRCYRIIREIAKLT